jgi:hypothetical protein
MLQVSASKEGPLQLKVSGWFFDSFEDRFARLNQVCDGVCMLCASDSPPHSRMHSEHARSTSQLTQTRLPCSTRCRCVLLSWANRTTTLVVRGGVCTLSCMMVNMCHIVCTHTHTHPPPGLEMSVRVSGRAQPVTMRARSVAERDAWLASLRRECGAHTSSVCCVPYSHSHTRTHARPQWW